MRRVRLLSEDARRAVFAPLDDGVVRSEAVVRRLGGAICLGLIGDGEQLPAESSLATSLNVSTMTLREALSDLRERGLVVTRRGRGGGSFVRARDDALSDLTRARLQSLGLIELRELGDIQATVSGAAARLAAERASEPEVARLRDIVERLGKVGRTTEQRRVDGRFYVELAACAQSVRLTMAEIDVQSEVGQLPWPAQESADRVEQTVAAHRGVVDAVRDRDGQLARTLVEEHVAARLAWLIQMRLDLARTCGKANDEIAPQAEAR